MHQYHLIAALFLLAASRAAARDTYDPIEMLCLVNRERANHRLPPLGLHPALERTAQQHSADQARMRRMTHDSSTGKSLGTRCSENGYQDWRTVGENVAYGYRDEATCMDAWMKSPGHRENILNPKFTHFGSAVDYSGDTPYYTQDFGGDGQQHSFPICPRDNGHSGPHLDDIPPPSYDDDENDDRHHRRPHHSTPPPMYDGEEEDDHVHVLAPPPRHPPFHSGPGGLAGRRPPVIYTPPPPMPHHDESGYPGDAPPFTYGGSGADDFNAHVRPMPVDSYGPPSHLPDDDYVVDDVCDTNYDEGADGHHDDSYVPVGHYGGDEIGDHVDAPAYGGDEHHVDVPSYDDEMGDHVDAPAYGGGEHHVDVPSYGDEIGDHVDAPAYGGGDHIDVPSYGGDEIGDHVDRPVPHHGDRRPRHHRPAYGGDEIGDHVDVPTYGGDEHHVDVPSYGDEIGDHVDAPAYGGGDHVDVPSYGGDEIGDHIDRPMPHHGGRRPHRRRRPHHGGHRPRHRRPAYDGDEIGDHVDVPAYGDEIGSHFDRPVPHHPRPSYGGGDEIGDHVDRPIPPHHGRPAYGGDEIGNHVDVPAYDGGHIGDRGDRSAYGPPHGAGPHVDEPVYHHDNVHKGGPRPLPMPHHGGPRPTLHAPFEDAPAADADAEWDIHGGEDVFDNEPNDMEEAF